MITMQVELGKRSYPIMIGSDLLSKPELIKPHVAGGQVMVVSNTTVAPLYLKKCIDMFSHCQVHTVILPDGEEYKNLSELNGIFDALLARRCDRQTTLVALGGGVVGDMTGFAAAAYQRGVPFIQIPTTLLAQVDSSVGGKTGVNHPKGKNMIGAFHQPQCVVADISTLDTLEDRQLVCGLAEVIKYGLLGDKPFFNWLEANINSLLTRQPESLVYAIEQSCRNKAAIVAKDELEGGIRALLNLGHTFGHAIESAMHYRGILHGEAVSIGMFMAATMSRLQGWISEAEVKEIESILKFARLPTRPPKGIKASDFIEHMQLDKKVSKGKIRLVLLKEIGQAIITDDYDPRQLENTIEHSLTTKED